MATWRWHGPFRIADLMSACLDDDHPWPPADGGVYVVSRRPWSRTPTVACRPLYFGGNTGRSKRFCTRVGDLVADMHGLYECTGHHSGGQSLWEWCDERRVHPGKLYIGWGRRSPWCARCAEIDVALRLVASWQRRKEIGLRNEKRPPWCRIHNRWIE